MNLRTLILGITLGSLSLGASAGILGDMTQMFMSNTTAPTSLSTKDRSAVFGGSFEMRSAMTSVNLVAFDPPRFDAGCGGIDLYGGSFSFINSAQLVQIFRAVAANAVGLAFKAAVNAISPSLGNLITEFQTLLQHMNSLAKNSCQLAHAIVNPIEKEMANAIQGDGPINTSKSGLFSDQFSALNGYLTNADHFLYGQAAVNVKSGNRNMKLIMNSGTAATLGMPGVANFDGSPDDPTNPNSLNNRLLISLMGYDVTAIPCQNQNAAGVPDTGGTAAGSTLSNVTCTGASSITLDNLVTGGGTGSMNPSVPLNLYTCVNPTGAVSGGIDPQICTSMRLDPFNYPGIRGFVNTALFGNADPALGVDPASLVGKFNAGASVIPSATQTQFMKQSGVNIVRLLSKTSNPTVRLSIAQKLGEHMVSCIASSVGEALYKAANGVQTGGDTTLSDDSKQHIAQLRTDYMKQRDVCLNDHKVLDVIDELNASTRLVAGSIK